MPTEIAPRDRLIVALDLPGVAEAEAMITRLGDAVTFYKIGMELTYAGGLGLAERLAADGKQVFMDLKLHDIPNTVERATRQIARLGARFLTVHGFSQSMTAALAGAAGSPLELLAVTVMTSYDDADLAAAGYAMGVKELVARRAVQAKQIGIHGLILSPEETQLVRPLVGPDMQLVTPGIRPAGSDVGDQKRIMTPALAIVGGADRLVVGRPVTGAADPAAAAESIVADIASALALVGKTNRT
ncbi:MULTISPECIES: orotidine-5'-phosphate decarboxylase [Bradyrhizobium]|jgi:orotidine-5'-phosphate decarboxylase|uniref:Orotidine 5'-phosphate decarboxylase n=2 Tax=Bradyrhizobium TaxID=374 RepID=A0ABS5GJ39_9BRAD|nr:MULTISPECIES: orotidine-5'-phosphate decarboxylase [Bradyrhizobium]MBR1140596.1 orotidine-5'-phosphate decarboxylase [Bradyrhizobium denitrificans]MDU1496989.1 orotidine-5'-phosphate decarboxylase [Bradyrhizobium sp.]MDU1547158.1 orotidine-5'-phosphate decarboxylase [Bradyrhizobium sp.]MDU1666472.1 orotidine-5'-phosphate decarboxylase [Bradyrhizobium sp.]MDU1689004.1 orotidine-5'-phosphate decarboxylase [Bradyrhizobium sp.]